MFSKLLNLFALSSLAIVVCTYGATPVTALSATGHGLARRSHGSIALNKRSLSKRQSSKRCRDRPAGDSTPPPTNNGGNNNTPAPQPTPTPAPPPPPPPAPPANTGGGKVGIAWALGQNSALAGLKTNNVKYVYTWSEYCPDRAKEIGLECIPMLWGGAGDKIRGFKNRVKSGYARYVAGFNEPNESSQANMSPEWAAQVWIDNIEPLRHQGYQLISPATTSAPNGIDWMRRFLEVCNGRCTFDFVAVHWYGTDQNALIRYLRDWHDAFHKPLMLTEFACMDFTGGRQKNLGEINKFYEDAFRFINDQSWIETAMPFGFMQDMYNVNPANRLLNGDNRPNALGNRVIHNQWY